MSHPNLKESVPGMSRLQYIMGILEDHGHKEEIGFNEIFQTVKKIGFQIEYERIKMSGLLKDLTKEEKKRQYEQQLENLTRRDVIRLLKRWNILEQTDIPDRYRFTDSSKTYITKILSSKKEGNESKQWSYLYCLALMAGEFFIFPGKYLLTLRSTSTGSLYLEEFAKKLGNVTINRSINMTSMRVISDWMELFGCSAKFPVIRPNGMRARARDRLIVSTKAIATLKEIVEFGDFWKKNQNVPSVDMLKSFAASKNLSLFEAQSIFQCALKIGIANINALSRESKVSDVIRQAIEKDMLVVRENGTTAKVIEFPEEVPADVTFVLTDFHLSLQSLYEILYHKMKGLCKSSYDYVWVSDLRREVCKETHIHPKTFDNFLKEIFRKYGPDVIETTGVYAATFQRKMIKEIPLNIDGRPIYKIRLKREKI
jgi:hypothetical protein